MKYDPEHGAYAFGNKHRPEIPVLKIDEKINKYNYFRDKNGKIREITTRELLEEKEAVSELI